jgi:hypothetical protein
MTRRNQSEQLTLVGGKREPIGTVEKAAAADLRELSILGMLTTATTALAAAYRRAARDVDRAERQRDPWAAASAMRELRALRLEIAPTASPLAGEGLSDLLQQISEVVRGERDRRSSWSPLRAWLDDSRT